MKRWEILFTKEEFFAIQKALGKRPGNYHLDPYYLRTGMGDKPYFWDAERKRWKMVRLGDLFVINEDGSIDHVPVDQVKGMAS
jgi:hypothetical protein